MCGKLKCCLNFEEEQYAEALALFPNTRRKLETRAGTAFFQKMDILKGLMWYSYEDKPDVFIPIHRDDVAEIQQMNSRNELPESLDDYTEAVENDIMVDNLLDNEDLNRFDKPARKKKKRRKKSNNNRNNQAQNRNRSANDRNRRRDDSDRSRDNRNQNRPNKDGNPNRPKNQKGNYRGKRRDGGRNSKGNNNPNRNQRRSNNQNEKKD